MKTLFAIMLLSSMSFAAPKDPLISIAKTATINLYKQHVSNSTIVKLNIIEQYKTFYLTQVINKDKQSFCFIFEIEIINGATEISIVENNNDIKNVFFNECDSTPDTDELDALKFINRWPNE
jgi:hypothetical protein